jgi:hypothetical protein
MKPTIRAASIILAIVGVLNWGYAAYRTVSGTPFEDSLPLVIGGLVCFTLIVVLNAAGKKKG